MRALVIISLLIFSACSNPLGGGESSAEADHAPFLLDQSPGVAFTNQFDFNSSALFSGSDATEISGGEGRLVVSDSLDNSTDVSGTDLNFAHYTTKDANITVLGNKIVMASGTTANFTSRIIDGKNLTLDWLNLKFTTTLPFGKEIMTTPEAGYGSSVSNFSANLIGLWHLNEPVPNSVTATADFRDTSASGNHGTLLGTAWTLGATGLFGKAVSQPLFELASTLPITTTQSFSYAFWVNPNSFTNGLANDGTGTYFADRVLAGNSIASLKVIGGSFAAQFRCGNGTNLGAAIGGAVQTGVWQHVAFVRDTSAALFRLYVNGLQTATAADTGCAMSLDRFRFGGHQSQVVTGLNGMMDEIAAWGRILTPTEILELYRRGANRIKFQIRTCIDATCSTNPIFVGSDGTNGTYLTEVDNGSSTPAVLNFANLSGLQAGFNNWYQLNKKNRFLQYKTIFESGTTTFPDLLSVGFDPQTRYASDNATVFNLPSNALNFNKITNFAAVEGSCNLNPRYELGHSNSNFLSWNGSSWVTSSGYSTANTKLALSTLGLENWQKFPKGSGSLYVKVYLPSDGTSPCSIDQVSISGFR